eukprot:1601408-Pyramimonas_sp.AAC.1
MGLRGALGLRGPGGLGACAGAGAGNGECRLGPYRGGQQGLCHAGEDGLDRRCVLVCHLYLSCRRATMALPCWRRWVGPSVLGPPEQYIYICWVHASVKCPLECENDKGSVRD